MCYAGKFNHHRTLILYEQNGQNKNLPVLFVFTGQQVYLRLKQVIPDIPNINKITVAGSGTGIV